MNQSVRIVNLAGLVVVGSLTVVGGMGRGVFLHHRDKDSPIVKVKHMGR
jgi:hypothetical protein